MIQKNYHKNGKICRVTFKLATATDVEQVLLCGDFTEWQQNAVLMKRLKDGSFSTTVSLPVGQSYHFRYLLNGAYWIDEADADLYVPNPYGSHDSVVAVPISSATQVESRLPGAPDFMAHP